MTRWTCPRCDREFARAHQAHVCVPGGSVAAAFAGYPAGHLEVYAAIVGHLHELGPVHEDAVSVGVFLKAADKLAEVRPKRRWVSLELVLPRTIADPRVTRTIRISADHVVHVIRLVTPADVGDHVRAWLTEAYDSAS